MAAEAVRFDTDPARYRHWRLEIDPPLAFLTLDVQEDGGLNDGYVLKLNSYDLGVDIELADAVQRLRFEHPEVRAVALTGGKEKVFCAGANIGMLARATHAHKVNFCKFTNETRLAMEDAGATSQQTYLCALNGTASGGGYELALATEHIFLVDDGSSAVSFPELPLLGVLPGTGGLTRLTDKRGVRRDIADVFSTRAEGVKGEQAVRWGLVDEVAPRSRFMETVRERAYEFAARSNRPPEAKGITLGPLEREATADTVSYPHVRAEMDRDLGVVTITITSPADPPPSGPTEIGSDFWPLAVARELDELILHLRFNEPELGTLVFHSTGDLDAVAAVDEFLVSHAGDWLVNEIVGLLKRTLKRIDVTSRSLVAIVEEGSCFAGTLCELVLGADRSYMLDDERCSLRLTEMNVGRLPMGNGLTRLESRGIQDGKALLGKDIGPREAMDAGLVTFAVDELDWDDEIRLALEERASFSPDALTALESNVRFHGPETLETKIFGRLSCWQNWIFSRPNATGPEGALPRYGTGQRAAFDKGRV